MTSLKQVPEPRKAYLKKIIDPMSKEHLDNGLLLWFPGKNAVITSVLTYLKVFKIKLFYV